MPLILRQIRKAKWYKTPDTEWLGEGELQADALGDLRTQNNRLSVWLVEGEAPIERVVTALAAGRDSLANFDYVLLDLQHLLTFDIRICETKGNTLDEGVNSWHRALVELSAQKLLRLAMVLWEHGTKKRIPERTILQLIKQGVEERRLDPAKLRAGIKAKVARER